MQVGNAERLGRLAGGLTLALAWLSLAVLPEVRAKPASWGKAVSQWRQASLIKLALELFDRLGRLPPRWCGQSSTPSRLLIRRCDTAHRVPPMPAQPVAEP
jgi:hypothetical protein